MKLVYENMKDDQKMEESKHEFQVDLGKLLTSFKVQIEEKTVEILNLKTELLIAKKNLVQFENQSKESKDKIDFHYKPTDLLNELNQAK